MKKLAAWAFIPLLAGCAAAPIAAYDYTALSAEATPEQWRAGAVWSFQLPPVAGKTRTVTYRITDRVADLGPGVVMQELEPVGFDLPVLGNTSLKPAYHVAGRYLIVDLASNWADLNEEIRGELTGGHFSGRYITGGMTGSTDWGPVQGWRVR